MIAIKAIVLPTFGVQVVLENAHPEVLSSGPLKQSKRDTVHELWEVS